MSRAGTLLMLLILWGATIAYGQNADTWHVQARLQVGAEYDSNIFESTDFPVEALAARGLLKTSAGRSLAGGKLRLGWSAGTQLYPEWVSENKLNHLLNGTWIRAVKPWWRLTLAANAQAKFFLQAPYDHAWTWTGVGSEFDAPFALRVNILAASSRLDYRASDRFDFLDHTLRLGVRRHGARRWQAELGVELSRVDFLRPAYGLDDNGQRFIRADRQQDDRQTIFLRIAYSGARILQVRLEHQNNDSNSEGYSWQRQRLYLVGAVPLKPRWLLRIALMGQRKRYTPTRLAVPLLDLDLERSESNYLILDLTHDLSPQLSWLLRLAWYNNEAAFRGYFYSKKQLLFGSEYRF